MSELAKVTRIAVYRHPDRPKLKAQWPVAPGQEPRPYVTRDGVRWHLSEVFTTDTIEIPAPARRAQEA